MVNNNLTEIEEKILNFLKKKRESYFAEIQREARIGSYMTVKNHVRSLEQKGYINIKEYMEGSRTRYRVILTEKGRKVKSGGSEQNE